MATSLLSLAPFPEALLDVLGTAERRAAASNPFLTAAAGGQLWIETGVADSLARPGIDDVVISRVLSLPAAKRSGAVQRLVEGGNALQHEQVIDHAAGAPPSVALVSAPWLDDTTRLSLAGRRSRNVRMTPGELSAALGRDGVVESLVRAGGRTDLAARLTDQAGAAHRARFAGLIEVDLAGALFDAAGSAAVLHLVPSSTLISNAEIAKLVDDDERLWRSSGAVYELISNPFTPSSLWRRARSLLDDPHAGRPLCVRREEARVCVPARYSLGAIDELREENFDAVLDWACGDRVIRSSGKPVSGRFGLERPSVLTHLSNHRLLTSERVRRVQDAFLASGVVPDGQGMFATAYRETVDLFGDHGHVDLEDDVTVAMLEVLDLERDTNFDRKCLDPASRSALLCELVDAARKERCTILERFGARPFADGSCDQLSAVVIGVGLGDDVATWQSALTLARKHHGTISELVRAARHLAR